MALKGTPLYNAWASMRQRCKDKNRRDYYNYGGRGIYFCDKWDSFEGFKEDMEESFKIGLSLDRIDNNGWYCKENCRWATRKVQGNNTRRNRFIMFNGTRKTLSEWSEFLGIKRSTLAQRFYVYKWDIKECFSKKQKMEV